MELRNGAIILRPGVEFIGQIKTAIPKAVQGIVGGEEAVAVKHKLMETLLLRNIGFDVPSPIAYGWKYCGMYPPRDNQVHTSAFMTLHKRAFILNAMRTGKTAASLWGSEYLLQEGFIRRVLIVCPKSCMRDVWEQALFECLPHRSVAILYGDKNARLKALERGTEYCIINHDGITALSEEVKKGKSVIMDCKLLKGKFDLIIYDEADVLCNHRTKLFKALKSLIEPNVWLWLMTGTPTPTKYSDAWGLLTLICRTLPVKSWTQFRELMMLRVDQFKWVNRHNAKEMLYSFMQPAIRFTKEQCFDLPPVQEVFRTAEMSKEQKTLYWQMQRDSKLHREEGDSRVIAANAAVKVAKMLQISSGAVKDEFGGKVAIDSRPRLEALCEVLAECGVKAAEEGFESKKVVVFMPYKYTMEDVKAYLEKKGLRVCLVNGDTPEWKRREIFKGFKGLGVASLYEVLVAHPEVTAHGLDLTVAESIIWYAPCFGSRLYQQGNERHQGEKQKGQPVIVHLSCTRLERERYASLKATTTSQADLLAMYERAVHEDV